MSEPRERRVAIACQGGGSHTAFTAGVLSRLLTADELRHYRVVGLSGTSGGAICALLAWSALRSGDRERAATLLEAFWDDNSARDPLDRLLNLWMVSAGVLQNLGVLPGVTPYAIPEPFSGMDQFRALLARHVDFDAIRADPDGVDPMLLLGAVDVISGRFRAFNSRQDRITADSVIASAAIPNLFRAVHTDGGVYWDGLFSQNPPVRDLLAVDPDELWVIQINPQTIDHEPRTLTEISDRRNELAGNLSLYQELGFIETIDRLLEEGSLSADAPYKHVSVRVIELPRSALPRYLGPASKLNRDPAFLRGLVERGREQADRFLGALAFERAWAARDADAVLGLAAPGATLVSESPFPDWDGTDRDPTRLREFVTKMLDQDIRIDSTRKQIAQDHVVWTIRMRNAAAPTAVEGVAEASFTGARISGLRLGPRHGPAR